jgi:hypothetical protein
MASRGGWVKISNMARLHRKFRRAGLRAFAWWVAALGWSDRERTDGKLSAEDLPQIWPGLPRRQLTQIVGRLVAVRSLDRRGRDYVIHDYLEWQTPAREIEAKRLNGTGARARVGQTYRLTDSQTYRRRGGKNGGNVDSAERAPEPLSPADLTRGLAIISRATGRSPQELRARMRETP